MFASSWFKVCAFFQSCGRLSPCVTASGTRSLISSGWFSLSRRFYHHPSLGCLRPLLVQHYPWPFEPRIFMVRFLSFMYKIFTDISFMCRTFIEIQSRRSISVLLLEQVRTWVGRRLGWGGDSLGWWTSDFTLGVVNVWGGECLGWWIVLWNRILNSLIKGGCQSHFRSFLSDFFIRFFKR